MYECNAIWDPRSRVSISNSLFKFKVNPVNSGVAGGSLFLLQPLGLQISDCSRDVRDIAALCPLLSQSMLSSISRSTNEGLKCSQHFRQ